MFKTSLTLILILFCSIGYSQNKEIPISYEVPKRGIYKTFIEFKFNSPGITDSFYVESKARKQKNWEGTTSYTPRYKSNDKKVKKVWGFSDGQKAYVFHQLEFFEVKLDTNAIGFYGYQEIDNSGAAVAGVLGGAIGGGLYAAVAIDNAKKHKIYYTFDFLSNKHLTNSNSSDVSNNSSQTTKLVLYRRDKKEKNTPLSVSLNDSTQFQLIPGSWKEFDVPISREPLTICYGDNLSRCIDIVALTDETTYLEGSISEKNHEVNLEQVRIEIGEFYAKQAKYFQDKREKKK